MFLVHGPRCAADFRARLNRRLLGHGALKLSLRMRLMWGESAPSTAKWAPAKISLKGGTSTGTGKAHAASIRLAPATRPASIRLAPATHMGPDLGPRHAIRETAVSRTSTRTNLLHRPSFNRLRQTQTWTWTWTAFCDTFFRRHDSRVPGAYAIGCLRDMRKRPQPLRRALISAKKLGPDSSSAGSTSVSVFETSTSWTQWPGRSSRKRDGMVSVLRPCLRRTRALVR